MAVYIRRHGHRQLRPYCFHSKAESAELTLVNDDNHVPDNWDVELTTLSNGERVASMIYPDLQEMFDDMRADGIYPFVRAGYRSDDEQKECLMKDCRIHGGGLFKITCKGTCA